MRLRTRPDSSNASTEVTCSRFDFALIYSLFRYLPLPLLLLLLCFDVLKPSFLSSRLGVSLIIVPPLWHIIVPCIDTYLPTYLYSPSRIPYLIDISLVPASASRCA
uniref:Uncharacterized protein n=1 Tax=Mycena chlorophos TaxID=658473 RepID=A0ABQ0M4F5_MYCCL|nr:predicted protein [Mycena chlorophos]